MYEAYIEARDSPLREVKEYCMDKNMDCGVFSFLKEWLYGVTLPQGFYINKDMKFIYFYLVISGYIFILIYL